MENRNILRTNKRRKADGIGHVLRRNCLLKHVIQGKIEEGIEVMGRRRLRRKQPMNDLKETEGYCNLKQEALYDNVENWLWKRLRGNVHVLETILRTGGRSCPETQFCIY
jgi:hypothetical protein